jgi:hypothetical protein
MNDDEKYGIGDALQYLGWGDQPGDYPMPTTSQAYLGSGDQEGDYPISTTSQAYLGSGDQEGDYPMPTNAQTPGAFGGSDITKLINSLKSAGGLKDVLSGAGSFLTSKTGLAGLLALLSYLDRQKGTSYGGGTTQAYAGPSRQLTPTTVQGKYGPLVQYAANGGLMQAYANGGKVQMEDGGFVMTKKAVDGAGGPRGIQQLVPGARMIQGPGTGTSDDIPAVIRGPNGITPAKVSNGEAYVPKAAVDDQGGAQRMYEIMKKLQRSA